MQIKTIVVMKRKFKFVVLILKNEKPYMEYTFNTLEPMYFSRAYNLLVSKIGHDFPVCLGYEFVVTSVFSKPVTEIDF